ncbi:CHASE2 domain-containing protein [Sphingomonas sp. RB56-2]|uniref:CHASE2 domain-containing protein n=2 Tax=Sphingomonas brevis TaxID=2908206 RepID=A0ABT0S9A4_9SPHN|nr:CHASE2 domain-containing protein [Sphingomonas brevis]
MRRGIFDSWQSARPRDLSATDVRVVMIDDRSIEMVGPWQWPRYYMARLTEELANRKAKVIAFDILFPERDRVRPDIFVSLYPELSPAAVAEVRSLEPMDRLFGEVIGASPVVLAHAGVAEAPADQPALFDAPVTGKMPPAVERWPAELAAIPELDDVAQGHGLINGKPDVDGVVRSLPLVMLVGGKPRPGFAAEIARNALGAESIAVAPSAVRIGGQAVPVDRHGRMRFHFGNFPSDKIISAAEVLGNSKRLKADEFAGKTVLVGLSAEGTSDIAATPLSAEEYGPLIQAQAVDAIMTGGWLNRPAWVEGLEWALGALLALFALGCAALGRTGRILLALAFVALPIASWLAFANAALLFDPARPMLVGAGAIAGVAMGLFAVARVERERLREALVQERVMAAEADGELQAARAIQLGMVPPRARLKNLDPRIDLDALLEPAKSIGGDYYDAMKIGEDQIGFAVADVTGKGVPAALFMAMSKALTSAALSRMEADPATMAAAINLELLKDNSEAMGVAILLGILDLKSGEARMVCAGHEDPLRVSAEGKAERIALDGGPPLCVADYDYPLETVTLQKGEILLLVTDGVTEAQNAEGGLFGRDRISREGVLRGQSATAIVDSIRDRVRSFEEGEEATDDLTVMALRYVG